MSFFCIIVLTKAVSAQTILDTCFSSATPGTSFSSGVNLVNTNDADLCQWTGSAWTGCWPGANLTIAPPINAAGCRAIFIGSGSVWTTGGEGFGLRFINPLIAGQTYTFSFTCVSHGMGSDGNFAPFIYTNSSGSLAGAYALGNLPAAGYTWTTVSFSFVATAAQAGHNWVIIHSGSSGSSGMIDSYCCSNTPPCSVHLPNDTTLCPGQTLLLNATTAGATYLWQNSSTNPTYTVTSAGTYWVSINVSGCIASDTIHVAYSTNPSVSFGNDTTLCQGQSLTLNATTPNCTYLWQNSTTNPTLTVTLPGTYTVTLTNNHGCTGSESIVVSTVANPTPVISGNTAICAGVSTTLDAGAGYTSYHWSTTATTETISPSTAGTYTVTVTNSNACSGTASVTVTLNANLTPTISGQLAICPGASTTLDAGAGYTSYLWSTAATTETISPSTAGNYSVTVTNAGGCSGTASVTVTQNAVPTPAITGLLTICPGASTTLDAGAGYASYLWSTTATTQTISPSTVGNYSVTVTNGFGCSGTASVTVTLNANLTPTITGQLAICPGASTTLDAGAGYATYLWSTTAATQTISTAIPGTYSVTVTNSGGCSGSTSVTVTQNTSPTPSITGQTSICPGTSTVLNAGNSYAAYLWSTAATTQTIPVTAAGTYSVTVSNASGCTGSTSVTVVVSPALVVTASAQPQTICPGNPVTLTATGGQTYVWNTTPVSTGASIVVNPTSTNTYVVTATSNGCTGSAFVIVTVNATLNVTATSTDAYCSQNNGTASANSAGTGCTYVWNTVPPDSTQTITSLAAGTYSVTVNCGGCIGTASTTVAQDIGPIAAFSTKPEVVTINEGPVTFYDESVGNITDWEWTFGDGSYASGSQVNHTYADSGSYFLTLIVTDVNGCVDTAEGYVHIYPYFAIWIPNSFTPNLDGKNDIFKPVGVGIDTKTFSMIIYNRWGHEMFSTTDINQGWNGTMDNKYDNSKCIEATYVYLIKVSDLKGKKYTYKGTVTLIM